eukprot:CAMPEP_0174266390 /NCGR_PEP_ID=MMETSP0439-20130205/30014_1 /TAXON_ID=0 /ORGANISM="Stereomyxa ramosa, Strain Chinc5" /LENGTH=505 /DNA_ID=CAMNT_0015353317 /DNA_START=29 /DNA_END=1546 /DNA_ORIENTATION=+
MQKVESEEALTLRRKFIEETKFLTHLELQEQTPELYHEVFSFILENNVELSTATRARVLGCSFIRKDKVLGSMLMDRGPDALTNKCGLPEVLRALELLDSGRKIRVLEKKLKRYEYEGTAKTRTIGKVKAAINDLKQEEASGAVTGALCRFIRKWLGTLPPKSLEFFALSFPKEPWRKLADIVHPKPDDFPLPWFLDFIYDKPIPEDCMVAECLEWKNKDLQTQVDLCEKWKMPYSFIRRQFDSPSTLANTLKNCIARYESINTLIWYYEDLHTPKLDKLIMERLGGGETLDFSYGKLMERLLCFKERGSTIFKELKPIAEDALSKLSLPLQPPIVVIGDASGSMQVAIKTAIIIASVLAALSKAELRFFNTQPKHVEKQPQSIDDVLMLAATVKAGGGTANAASLWKSYENKEQVNYFIMVTDEEENQSYKNHKFLDLFLKYQAEVYSDAQVVFVSFLRNMNDKGQMVSQFKEKGIDVLQFKLNRDRPDLQKLDKIIAMLSDQA